MLWGRPLAGECDSYHYGGEIWDILVSCSRPLSGQYSSYPIGPTDGRPASHGSRPLPWLYNSYPKRKDVQKSYRYLFSSPLGRI